MGQLYFLLICSALVFQCQSADQSSKCVDRSYWQPLVVDDSDPHQFHVCKDGRDIGTQWCPMGTIFSEAEQVCVHDDAVDAVCSQHPTGRVLNTRDPHSFYVCQNGKAYLFQCPAGLVYSDTYQVCVWDV